MTIHPTLTVCGTLPTQSERLLMRPRTPTPTELDDLTHELTRLHAALTADHATATLQRIAVAAQVGYPTRTLGNNGGGSSDDRLPTDALDPTSRFASEFLTELRRLRGTLITLNSVLAGWNPDRAATIPVCPVCDTPLPEGRKRCPKVDENGVRCGKVLADCKGCGQQLLPGRSSGGRCRSCARWFDTHGYDKCSVAGYRQKLEDARAFVGEGAQS